jgi:hypothetical protein
VREPAKSPAAARTRYVRFLQLSLSCLTKAVWFFTPGPPGRQDDVVALVASEAPVRLQRSHGPSRLSPSPTQLFKIIPDERYEGEYKAQTLAYIYTVHIEAGSSEDAEFVAWHWHPPTTPGRTEPHPHVHAEHRLSGLSMSRLHIPTGRVSFEQVVRFLVDDLEVVPPRHDWRDVIAESEERFRAFRTWS